MLRQAKVRVVGHLSYYAITDNSDRCATYLYHVKGILFKWLNRKSQRNSYTWPGYRQALKWVGWPKVSIRKDLNPFRSLEAI
jgi:RNA-directed DNA polymerase